jgi:RNA polymerase sigma-70 factor (ECF subfamily)
MGSHSRAEPTTRPSLLIRLRDRQDQEAWRSFNRLYGPLIFDFCRVRGLQEQDAAEVMQETLLQISKSIETFEYQSERGRFRGWVGTIVRSKLVEFHRKRQRMPKLQETPLEKISATSDGTWNDVWLEHVVQAALAKVRSRLASQTWNAFRMVWLDHRDPNVVAQELGRDIAWVYLAKSRGLNLLREEVTFLADEPLQSIESVPEKKHAVRNHAGTTS